MIGKAVTAESTGYPGRGRAAVKMTVSERATGIEPA